MDRIGLIRSGDHITIDADSNVLAVDIDDAEMQERRGVAPGPGTSEEG